jgi:hypothetical protein
VIFDFCSFFIFILIQHTKSFDDSNMSQNINLDVDKSAYSSWKHIRERFIVLETEAHRWMTMQDDLLKSIKDVEYDINCDIQHLGTLSIEVVNRFSMC